MDLRPFQEFRKLQAVGRKPEARAALERFIASFEPGEDRQPWVREYLESGDYGHRIRHELYERVIFPVLLDGYRCREVWSLLWLAKTAQNLYASSALHAHVDFRTEQQLLHEAYRLEPTAEVRQRLLDALLNRFTYCGHEWPAGILYGIDGASAAECEELLTEVNLARTLDATGANEPFLHEFECRLRQYRQRSLEEAPS